MPAITCQSEQSWLEKHTERAIDEAFAAIYKYAQSPNQFKLLATILSSALGRGEIKRNVCEIASHLPLLVYFATCGNPDESIYRLTGALTLLEAGIYTLDHIMDEEIDGELADLSQRSILLGAICLLSHLPNQVLLALPEGPTVTANLAQMLADGLATIGAGQLEEVASNGERPTREAIEATVRLKTGERRALLAAMAATLAGASHEQVSLYRAFGRNLGSARQFRSDLVDLFGEFPSRDILSRTITLPLALYLNCDDPEKSAEMLTLLTSPSQTKEIQCEVCDRLLASGAVREVARTIEGHCKTAIEMLDEAQPLQPAGTVLKTLARAPSLAVAQ